MNLHLRKPEAGNVLLCALGTIVVLSIIGATVLDTCTARYNASSKQIKGWKEALYAAEAGGDIAFNEVRKYVTGVIPGGSTPFTDPGWSLVNPATGATTGTQASGPWYYTLPQGIGDSKSSTATVAVDRFVTTASGDGAYRIRSIGTARVFGLRRTGLNDGSSNLGTNFAAGITRGDGDSLIRKIDFNTDHFIATYGDGDGTNLRQVAVPADANGNPLAQVSRRIELIAVPIMPVTGALLANGSVSAPGPSGIIDSYDSKNGAYPGAATATNPAAPFYSDSRNANVVCGSSAWSQGGWIYGNVSTNGGNASQAKISGVVDNNQPITTTSLTLPNHPPYQPATPTSFTPVASSKGFADASTPWYLFTSNWTGGTISNPSGIAETYVNIVVNGDVDTTMVIAKGVNVRYYFSGNLNVKGKNYVNNNIDGVPTTNPSRAGHAQFYGLTGNAAQQINLTPPGDFYGLVYAPGAAFSEKGNNDFYGAIVCGSFAANGGTSFHFDKELATKALAIDYRLASYIEDVR